jgi:hypothetical protein
MFTSAQRSHKTRSISEVPAFISPSTRRASQRSLQPVAGVCIDDAGLDLLEVVHGEHNALVKEGEVLQELAVQLPPDSEIGCEASRRAGGGWVLAKLGLDSP